MGDKSLIEWTDATWNPVTGCTRVSEGCRNCYMARTVPRQGLDPWKVVLHPNRLEQPLRWQKPRRIFVNSLSDLFHEDVPDEFIEQVFGIMASCPRHTFQVLTKRPKRMYDWMQDRHPWTTHPPVVYEESSWPPKNVWLGVSVENQETADERIPLLLQTPAAVRFVSAEPLLGPVDLDQALWFYDVEAAPNVRGLLNKLHWVIVGGESGPGARPMHPDWARSIRDQCHATGVPFFFKQWGEWAPGENVQRHTGTVGTASWVNDAWRLGRENLANEAGHRDDEPDLYRVGKKAAGSMLDGREWKEWPEDLRVREFPVDPRVVPGVGETL